MNKAQDTPTRHRSGAVARMLRMPVATLRIWERRYALTRPALSPSGQRLYSADDVRRLALIKQLTDLGHDIGSLAPLDMAQLQQVAATHATTLASRVTAAEATPARERRLVVIGAALGARLRRPALLRQLPVAVEMLGPFNDAAQAAAAVDAASVDAVLVDEPQLHTGWRTAFDAAAPALAGLPTAVLYGFAADAVCDELARSGTRLLRGPQPDAVVAQWLAGLIAVPATTTAAAGATTPSPRRWSDAALADFAGLSSTIACECPRHVAELLVQLSHFEAYSADCLQRSPDDAELHAHLAQVAASCRAKFEAALEHVARHEGLLLPR
ncbi:MerR family transcriptional regulator [Roseateles sp. LYH14W]|uniref:MerR family transcriptional regulator n=1 Tax=Pelomonas parva TaxID=3299032 RepID=A0ABW7EVX3_9BURK